MGFTPAGSGGAWSPNTFLDPEGGSQSATLVVLVVVILLVLGISSVKMPKAFLECSAAQRNFAC